mmetsp:Transcript_9738/g.27844  ORF Transcript_9738/g.27844 Transcript_9738/m.27844 type:complete len:499 (-) Transcript_9738:71-1567(-)
MHRLIRAVAALSLLTAVAAVGQEGERPPPGRGRQRLRVRPMLSAAGRQAIRGQPVVQEAAHPNSAPIDLSKMRYWTEMLSEAPADPLPITDKFISFEPWSGGFNNIRMSLELAMALALATNRTLVLPDRYRMYKLQGLSGWDDFFDLEDMARGVPIIHQKDFQQLFGLPNPAGRTEFPKARNGWSLNNYVNRGWQGVWEISKAYGFGEDENANGQQAGMIYCVPDCPAEGSPHYQAFQTYTRKQARHGHMVSTSTSSWDSKPVVHFSQNGLGHWYTSVFIRPLELDIAHKRAMKTHCHFNDEIFDSAETVLRNLLHKAPSFSCIHIRRSDFQFKQVLTPIAEIVDNTKNLFREGEDLWVMTEEGDPHGFFRMMKDRYKLHFLQDYVLGRSGSGLLRHTKKHLLPMIESVICSRGRVFSGTYLSTLTGYILRLRGYQEDIEDKTAYFNQMRYPDDYLPTWDNTYPTFKHSRAPKGVFNPGWGREFREVWDFDWIAQHGF